MSPVNLLLAQAMLASHRYEIPRELRIANWQFYAGSRVNYLRLINMPAIRFHAQENIHELEESALGHAALVALLHVTERVSIFETEHAMNTSMLDLRAQTRGFLRIRIIKFSGNPYASREFSLPQPVSNISIK